MEVLRVQTEPDDRRFRAERARGMDSSRILAELAEVDVDITAELYGIVYNKPMTTYFDGYQVLQLYLRHARVREALLSTFNQFLDRFSSIVRPRARPARLGLLDYASSDSIEAVIDRYTAKELDIQSAVALVKPSDRRNV